MRNHSVFERCGTAALAVALLAGAGQPAIAKKNSSPPPPPNTVEATVFVGDPAAPSVCLLVEGTQVDFGDATFSSPGGNATLLVGDVSTVLTNCSGAHVELTAKGSAAVSSDGSAVWNLTQAFNDPCDAGLDLYGYLLVVTDPPTEGGLPLSETHQSLQPPERPVTPAGEGAQITHGLFMPCAGSSGNGQQVSMSVEFRARVPQP